jgi:hypothetical protein
MLANADRAWLSKPKGSKRVVIVIACYTFGLSLHPAPLVVVKTHCSEQSRADSRRFFLEYQFRLRIRW